MKINTIACSLMKLIRWKFLWIFCSFLLGSQQAYAASRCAEYNYILLPDKISCSYQSLYIPSSSITEREVLFQLPLGTPPKGGWPVALIYQGSIFQVEFTRTKAASFGGYYELKTIKKLLDSGYAVIAPRAPLELTWLTNSAGPLTNYEITTDYTFLNNVFDAIDQGVFGPLNGQRKYATGISSGGYNTSRMALTWPGEFKALVVHSGSWATCLGPQCLLPSQLPANHAPTKFIHGYIDTIVPWWTMDAYYDRLLHDGVETERMTILTGGHEWFPQSPDAVVDWFNRHP